MSEDFDLSPRASKRRRTTPSTTKTSVVGSTKKTARKQNAVGSATTVSRRVSNRLKAVGDSAEEVDSAYASKEDSLVEDADAPTVVVESGARQTATLQSAESMEIPETPGEVTGTTIWSTKRKTPRSSASAAKSTPAQKQSGSTPRVPFNGTGRPRNKAVATEERDKPKEDGDAHVTDLVDEDAEVEESQDELQAEAGPQTLRSGSTRVRRRPRRYSVDSQPSQDQSPAPSRTITATASAAPSPQPRGILTPSKGRRNTQRKSVLFETGNKEFEEQLGFKDIDTSAKKTRRSARPTKVVTTMAEDEDEEEDPDLTTGAAPTFPPADQDPLLDFDQPLDILASLEQVEAGPETSSVKDTPVIEAIKTKVLARLTSLTPCAPAPHLASQQSTLTNLLTSTVVSGESNSLLLLGPRGAGKTLLLEHVLSELNQQYSDLFHTVRLNGFFQTDDRVALREIWRQLGRETQDDNGEENVMAPISYADTLASLLSLLSHPDEMDVDAETGPELDLDAPVKTAKSVVIILDEFDLFTLHPRQTLLYNLFDIAQSRKAPIAVIGCSTRMDAVESLEKRVKSRFSHRWLHVPPVRTVAEMQAVVNTALQVSPIRDADVPADQRSEYARGAESWNKCIQTTFTPSKEVSDLTARIFHTTRCIPELFSALYSSISTLAVRDIPLAKPEYFHLYQSPYQQTVLALLPTLPTLHLSLLAALSSPSYPSPLPSFTTTYAHYTHLLARTRLAHSSARARTTGAAASLRQWGRELCVGAWEDLLGWGVLVRQGSGKWSEAAADEWEGTGCEVTDEEVLWALKARQGAERGVGAGEAGVLVGWVRGEVS